ncbi:MAG: hypothetical protein ACRDUV_12260, partial [Pseudonocardiaceae bacterium]
MTAITAGLLDDEVQHSLGDQLGGQPGGAGFPVDVVDDGVHGPTFSSVTHAPSGVTTKSNAEYKPRQLALLRQAGWPHRRPWSPTTPQRCEPSPPRMGIWWS